MLLQRKYSLSLLRREKRENLYKYVPLVVGTAALQNGDHVFIRNLKINLHHNPGYTPPSAWPPQRAVDASRLHPDCRDQQHSAADLNPTLNLIEKLGVKDVHKTPLAKLQRLHNHALKRAGLEDKTIGKTCLYQTLDRFVEDGRSFESLSEILDAMKTEAFA